MTYAAAATRNACMEPRRLSRRQFVAAAAAAGSATLAGCSATSGGDTPTGTATGTPTPGGTDTPAPTDTDEGNDLVAAIEAVAVPVDPSAPAGGFDTVAARVGQAPVVGIGENSHGVRAFKRFPHRLVRRLVADHGHRLVAMEGTLGGFERVDRYVAGEDVDLDAALSSLGFYFWRTEGLRALFEWLREFNADRPADDRAVVRGYDAQFYHVNAAALRAYLDRVDPAYLAEVEDRLAPLATPPGEVSDPDYLTDARVAFLDDLRARLRDRKSDYVDASSRSAWELALRHGRTLERGLRFYAALHGGETARAEALRDEAMAGNVRWLRDWTGASRAVVLGNANHTMRGYRGDGERNARLGQHLHDELGDDYYSLGQLFGTGEFAVPTNHAGTAFESHALGGPLEGTPAATLAEVPHPRCFLDLDAARERAVVGDWLDGTGAVQFTVPRAAERGAVPLPASPGEVYDGMFFAREVSPARFVAAD
jgi:erythromycin esterase